MSEEEGGIDFEVDGEALEHLFDEPLGDMLEGDLVDGDVFGIVTAAGSCADEVSCAEEGDGFVGDTWGGGSGGEEVHGGGEESGFLLEFADGGVGEIFGFGAWGVADEACGDFDDLAVDGMSELLDEEEFVVVGDCDDADDAGGAGSLGEFPGLAVDKAEVLAFGEDEVVVHVRSPVEDWRGRFLARERKWW